MAQDREYKNKLLVQYNSGKPIPVAARSKGAHTCTSLARESGSASLTREPGSDIFHHTRMS
jgi:hypothetical protein